MSKSRKKDVKSDIKSDEIIENSGKNTDAGISENIDGTVEAKTEDIIEDAASEERSDAVKEEPAEDKKVVADKAADEADKEAGDEADEEASNETDDDAGDEIVAAEGGTVISGKTGDAAQNAEFRKLPFIEKCKKDPMIPVSILLAFVAVMVAALYFMLPNAKTPSMGITLTDFIHNFNNGGVATSLMDSGADIGFRTPPYVDPSVKPSIMGDKAIITADAAYADFFAGPSKYFINAGIEGATRKNDNMLSYFRIWVQYSDLSDDADFNSVWMYFSNTLNALYPEMNTYEAMGIAMKKMGEFDGDPRFYARGDYAFRLVPVQKDEVTYIAIDVVPKSALKDTQIRETMENAPASAAVESVPDATVPSVSESN